MAAKKAAKRTTTDPFIPLWAESMVPELSRELAEELNDANHESARLIDGPIGRKLAELGLLEFDESGFALTDAGEYVLKRLKELGWLP